MSMALSGPAWFDEKGEPADLSGGMWSFLTKMCDRLPDTDLGLSLIHISEPTRPY